MAMTPLAKFSDAQVELRLRKAAELIDRADALIQSTFEADDDLYEFCTKLQDLCGDLEMEADELASLEK
jgi:phosphoglycerate-specific signal transduction histidine kinase